MSDKSYEVLRRAMANVGVKAVAAKMGLSESLVYKWAQEPSEADFERSGAKNPLDRLLELYQITGNQEIVAWLCEQAGGYFVENPKINPEKLDPAVIKNTQLMIKEFSDMLGEISSAMGDDANIDEQEAKRIRREWEDLKRRAEMFVSGCERGSFKDPK
ncbi:MAG TPA: helix-turn-helix domain-containing protein [Planctomycetota bacterium]|nr:helix-turn-helix domain-containing protein [Planctomycetota bacterium]